MSDEPINLVLEHLRHLGSAMDRLHDDMRDVKDRLTGVELAVVSLRRDVVSLEESHARIWASHDRHLERTARIERRLDISDTPA